MTQQQITCANTQLGAWASHVQGAVALVKLRGREQLRNPISRRLFEAVRAHMVGDEPIIFDCLILTNYIGSCMYSNSSSN